MTNVSEGNMKNDRRPRFAAVGEALPAAFLVWKVGTRLVQQAGNNPFARRWARIGAVAAGIAGVAAILVGVGNTLNQTRGARHLEQRLDDTAKRIHRAANQRTIQVAQKLAALAGRLESLSPLNVLTRG